MKTPLIINVVLFGALLYAVYAFPTCMVTAAGQRLVASQSPEAKAAQAPPTAAASEEGYCSEGLKTVLRRVLTNCGLIGGGRRGCQPGELRNVAQISDADFNSLFKPLGKRGGIVLFDKEKEDLDAGAKALIEKQWAERLAVLYGDGGSPSWYSGTTAFSAASFASSVGSLSVSATSSSGSGGSTGGGSAGGGGGGGGGGGV